MCLKLGQVNHPNPLIQRKDNDSQGAYPECYISHLCQNSYTAISPSKLAQPDPTLGLAALHHNSCKISPSSRLTEHMNRETHLKAFCLCFHQDIAVAVPVSVPLLLCSPWMRRFAQTQNCLFHPGHSFRPDALCGDKAFLPGKAKEPHGCCCSRYQRQSCTTFHQDPQTHSFGTGSHFIQLIS